MQYTHPGTSIEKAVAAIRELIQQESFCQRHRARPQDFTRQRHLTFVNSVVFLLQKTVRSIQAHLHAFLEALGQADSGITPSAWSQARRKLRHTAFVELNEQAIVNVIYPQPGSFEIRRWKGHRLVAIDSSLVRLPNDPAVGREFGWVDCTNDHGACGRYPQGRLSALTDVLNRIALETLLVPWAQGERGLALRHIGRLEPMDVGLLDRGFCEFRLMAEFVKADRRFVCRCPRSSFQAVNQLFAQNVAGRSVQVPLRASAHQREEVRQAGLPEAITVRLVTVRLSTGELEVLMTNLLDEQRYPTECFGELYQCRWGVETYYGLIKGRLDLGNFTGLSPEAVRQDVYATVLLSNLESILTRPSDQQLAEHSQGLKHRQQVNHAVCFHALKSQLIALLLSQEPIAEVVDKLAQLFLDNPTTVRPNRQVPRKKPSAWRSYHYQRHVRKVVF